MNLRFFDVQFDDTNINRQQLRKFTEDHLKRMAANNDNNQYNALLADTQAAYEAYFGALNNSDASSALRQSRTKNMNAVKQQFATLVSKREGLITNFFDKDSPEYQEFFPQGLTEYNKATLENIETLMSRLITAATAHADVLGSNLAAEFTQLKQAFVQARGEQLQQKGTGSKHTDTSNEAKEALQAQLTKNLLTIALNNVGKPGAAVLFFDNSIISRPAAEDVPALAEPQKEPVK